MSAHPDTDRSRFVPWAHSSPLLDAIGGFRYDPDRPLHLGFTVEGAKLNARGFLHAGVISTIGDIALGHSLARQLDPPLSMVTINLSCDFVGSAYERDWVDIAVTPTRVGRRLAAGIATFSTHRPIATVTGLFMPVLPKVSAEEGRA
jgi:acyl-coenzyme A thioesterase PaaI-like protein